MKKVTNLLLASVVLIAFFGTTVQAQWPRHIIDNIGIDDAVSAEFADLSGDSVPDLLIANWLGKEIVWYENDFPEWKEHLITYKHSTFSYTGDIDGDDDLDVVACLYNEKRLVWYENNPPNWTIKVITNATNNADYIFVIDMNKDGKLDVVAAGDYQDGGDLVWYENNYPDSWPKHVIDPTETGYPMFKICDVDGDGNLDVVATLVMEGKVVWYQNNGDALSWTPHVLSDETPYAFGVNSYDMNDDGKLDILVTSRNENYIYWFENQLPDWEKHVITTNLHGADDPSAIDVDGDGIRDIVAEGFHGDIIVWYEEVDTTWVEHLIEKKLDKPRQLVYTDLDGDGVTDIACAGNTEIVWYKNPYTTSAWTRETEISPCALTAGESTDVQINAHISNPANHTAEVSVLLRGKQSEFEQEVQLYDDGLHGDEAASDSIFGETVQLTELEEDIFSAMFSVYDPDNETDVKYLLKAAFTTIGPLTIDAVEPISSGEEPLFCPDRMEIYISLSNQGETAPAFPVKARLNCTDPLVSSISVKVQDYTIIYAGETEANQSAFVVYFPEDLPTVPTEVQFELDIYYGETVFWQDTFSIWIVCPDALEPDDQQDIRIYPNPAHDKLNIEYPVIRVNAVEIAVWDVTGKKVYAASPDPAHTGKAEIDISVLSEGLYIVTMQTGQHTVTRKFIKY